MLSLIVSRVVGVGVRDGGGAGSGEDDHGVPCCLSMISNEVSRECVYMLILGGVTSYPQLASNLLRHAVTCVHSDTP